MQASKTGPESKKGWRKKIAFWFGGLVPPVIGRRFLIIVRLIEFVAVILAVIAFFIDYRERDRDRAVRNAQLIAQIADLSKGDEAEKVSPAIKNIMELLAKEDVSMRGIVVPEMDLRRAKLSGADLSGADLFDANLAVADLRRADLRRADLREADLPSADLRDADLRDADLSEAFLFSAKLTRANLSEADLSGAYFSEAYLGAAYLRGAYLSGANLEDVTDLTQDQLDLVMPSPPPRNLPEHLSWPFKENDDGKWVPINAQVPANMAPEIYPALPP